MPKIHGQRIGDAGIDTPNFNAIAAVAASVQQSGLGYGQRGIEDGAAGLMTAQAILKKHRPRPDSEALSHLRTSLDFDLGPRRRTIERLQTSTQKVHEWGLFQAHTMLRTSADMIADTTLPLPRRYPYFNTDATTLPSPPSVATSLNSTEARGLILWDFPLMVLGGESSGTTGNWSRNKGVYPDLFTSNSYIGESLFGERETQWDVFRLRDYLTTAASTIDFDDRNAAWNDKENMWLGEEFSVTVRPTTSQRTAGQRAVGNINMRAFKAPGSTTNRGDIFFFAQDTVHVRGVDDVDIDADTGQVEIDATLGDIEMFAGDDINMNANDNIRITAVDNVTVTAGKNLLAQATLATTIIGGTNGKFLGFTGMQVQSTTGNVQITAGGTAIPGIGGVQSIGLKANEDISLFAGDRIALIPDGDLRFDPGLNLDVRDGGGFANTIVSQDYVIVAGDTIKIRFGLITAIGP